MIARKAQGEKHTSEAITQSAFQSIRGRILRSKAVLRGISLLTSEHSFGCRGKDALVDLQAFTAQVRKLRVRSFIFLGGARGAMRADWWVVSYARDLYADQYSWLCIEFENELVRLVVER